MIFLIKKLKKFFETNKNLLDFKSTYEKLMKNNSFIFKKEFVNGTYTKNLLFRNETFEIVLISWAPNSIATFHCHPPNGCLLHVLNGNLIEKRKKNNSIYEINNLKEGDTAYMHCDLGMHEVSNENNYDCYSLHIYSPPCFYD